MSQPAASAAFLLQQAHAHNSKVRGAVAEEEVLQRPRLRTSTEGSALLPMMPLSRP